MLINLYIENYVLFDKQNLNFSDGFISLTGDTGAGKSLIIDALSYLCGERLKGNVSKDHNKNTFIEGTFTFTNSETIQKLEDYGIEQEDIYIVSRDIQSNGKSVSRINGRSVTQSFLKELFERELDIHSQRDNQYLLNKNMHLELLDKYSNHEQLLENTKESFTKYNTTLKKIKELETSVYNEVEIEFIKSQIKEIDLIKPDEAEYESLLSELNRINSYEVLHKGLSGPSQRLKENQGILDLLHDAKEDIRVLDEYPEYNSLIERLNSSYLELVDIEEELANELSELSFNQYEADRIEERLFEINQIIKRYGGSFSIFNERYQEMYEKIEAYESKDIVLYELNKQLKQEEEKYLEFAKKLSLSRQKNIKKLEKDIMEHLKDLQLENAVFKISMQEKDYSMTGLDDVEYLVAMNKGFELNPLSKVASGGELSRLMLGLKVIFSKLFGVSTVIFDEIDTGVSGNVALSIGYKMNELSKTAQVFAVTHLAQVAACSNTHFYVEKDTLSEIGTTTISELKGSDFIEKLAFMSSGIISEASIKASQELYLNAQEKISDTLE